MAVEQTILFTVLPRGLSLTSPSKPVSVFVSPRLDGASRLGAFADWLNWTRHLRDDGLDLEFRCGTQTRFFPVNPAPLRPELWEQLFNADTFVRSHKKSDDYTDRGMISFPMRETLSALKSIYQQASVVLALPDSSERGRQEESNNRTFLAALVNGLQVHWDGREARASRARVRDLYSSSKEWWQAAGPLDHEGLLTGHPDENRLRSIAFPFSVFHHMPTPEYDEGIQKPDLGKLIDFHQALTSLNSYPELLRALGLVLDFDLPNDFISKTAFNKPGTLAVQRPNPGWDWAITPKLHPLETAYLDLAVGQDDLFFTAPRSVAHPGEPGTVFGLLDLDPAHFGLAQVDVDGAMHKAIMLAETLHPSGEHNLFGTAKPQNAQHPEVFDPEATLPSLRSGGFSLFADNRASQLLQTIRDSKKFNDAVKTNSALNEPFYSEDLVRGYRLDVWDSRTNAWHSLHLREGKYVVGNLPFQPTEEPEEGFVELAATQSAPGARDSDRELYLHEAIARWAGWSLSVPRPGKHLSRYANAKDAIPNDADADKFAENEPVTPFKITADYRIVKGSLPPLRFGVRYRIRARAVDLAGNSIPLGGGLADALAPVFALPRDPEGFAYLRFEPVPAPLVVIRDEASVQAPGSAVDRLVIRTFNDDVSKDDLAADTTAADRHIIPPRASIEMGERLSAFDDASGKLRSDAATWKLIGERDLGELNKKKIIIKGRSAQNDGSDEYPLEPAPTLDQLPFFPDPLARGAAIRDLPGTPSGAVGKVTPDVGVEARIDYQALSDPNPRPGSATLISFGETGNWEDTHGFRLVLSDPPVNETDHRPNWDPLGRVLTVYLPKGQTKVVPLTSYLNTDDLKLMGVWQWLREYIENLTANPRPESLQRGSSVDEIAHVLQRTVEGGHWMLTPPHLLTLVHAVQQPIGRPEFTALSVHHEVSRDPNPLQTTPGRGRTDPTELASLTAWRRPGSTEAYLLGALKIHGVSTARVDLLATWDDPDDSPKDKMTTTHHAGPVDELPLPSVEDTYLLAAGAVERPVGYYDSEHDQMAFVRSGDNTTWEDYGFYQAAPCHMLNDTKHHVITYTATASSRYREYFDPNLDPAKFTRTSEPIVVDVPASMRPLAPDVVYVVPTFGWERQTDTNLKRSVRFGGGLRVYLNRPWFSSGKGELLGVALWSYRNGSLDQQARDKFKPFFTQWGMDPIWETAGLSNYPGIENFPDRDDGEEDLSLEESPVRISVAGFAPQYDEVRKLWFADLTININSETYMPFVRLALVRYQPYALADAKVSRVVLADFAQLTPDRSAMVTADPYHPRTIRIVVSGVAPRGPKPIVHVEPLPKSPVQQPTKIKIRVQQRDPAITSDLAWNDVSSQIAVITPEKLGASPDDPDFVIWTGAVTFKQKPVAGQFRLLIEEHEYISAKYTETENGVVTQPGRLVYAEIFALDQALIG